MTTLRPPLRVLLACLLLAGCAEDAAQPGADASDADAGSGGGVFADAANGDIVFGGQDTAADAVDIVDTIHIDPSAWPPCEGDGGPGCPCEGNGDCASGWCVSTGDGKVCTVPCEETCPIGWSCAPSGTPPDIVYLCIALHTKLCRPCLTGADCAQEGETGGWCLARPDGQGSFCGAICDDERPCPGGFACELVPVGGGKEVTQCVPTGGECPCNALAIKDGAETACTAESELGSCEGRRRCTASGLGECDASPPVPETCNGQDDDCDGLTDDALDGACVRTNAFGTCAGSRLCLQGQWGACDATEPALEECNGLDDDCDGLADDGFDNADGDALADCVDDDDDGDGVLDAKDKCPLVPDPDQGDVDDDGLGDACDPDMDGDGAANVDDCAPKDPSWICTIHYWDGDGDGIGKCGVKQCLCGPADKYTLTVCTAPDCDDADPKSAPGLPELCDGKDNDCNGKTDDGVPDTDADGVKNDCDPDDDGDGRPDVSDNCPLVPNPDQKDADGDQIGDLCDGDLDGDGIDDLVDICPGVWNPGQEDCDGNGVGDACDEDDGDGDGVLCEDDNCPLHVNPDQLDTDADGQGDVCDADDDNDGVPDTADCAPLDPSVFPGASEACNGKDDDCDGKTDEGYPTLGIPCDGPDDDLCKSGVMACDAAGTGVACSEPATGGGVEVCNGKDDDCDGQTDEGVPGTGEPCDGPDADLCADGTVVCSAAGPVCEDGGPDLIELCNGADDDCDGQTDEGFPGLGEACDGPDADLCANGALGCAGDGLSTVCAEAGAGKAELCNGVDDDCDGETDEDWPALSGPCDGPDADQCPDGSVVCNGSGTGTTCIGDTGDAKVETCNGVDDDCDGQTDEDYLGLGKPCDGPDGDGCKNGLVVCSADGAGITCDEPLDAAVPELCNGVDDDCDGQIDEGFAALGGPCDGPDADACARGVTVCTAAGDGTTCDEAGKPVTLEACNGADDDCDGATDEDWPTLGIGCDGADPDLCAGGKVVCTAAGTGTSCQDPGGGSTEVCDGVDNDCDGATDEGFPTLGEGCDSDDSDFCELGTVGCAPGGAGVSCKETIVDLYELCDGADNDCDAVIDEDYPTLGQPCDGPDADHCPNGAIVCGVAGIGVACKETGPGIAETCNGLDDDCDGQTDESYADLGQPCDGPDEDACANGKRVCAPGGAGTTCADDAPKAEACNGLDDDCDGATDEDFPLGALCDGADTDLCDNGVTVCGPDGGTACSEASGGVIETCNGVDDDCDGETDESWPELGEACDGPDGDECANGVVICGGEGLPTCGAEAISDLVEDCATAADDDCDGLVNEGCVAGSVRLAFPSFVLPPTVPGGATYGAAMSGGESVVGPATSEAASFGVRLGGVGTY